MAGVTWTERTATQSVYHEGTPVAGAPVRVLFGAIVFNQGGFVYASTDYTERTASSSSHTERTVSESTYTERTV